MRHDLSQATVEWLNDHLAGKPFTSTITRDLDKAFETFVAHSMGYHLEGARLCQSVARQGRPVVQRLIVRYADAIGPSDLMDLLQTEFVSGDHILVFDSIEAETEYRGDHHDIKFLEITFKSRESA